MNIFEITLKESRQLGGFPVKPLNIEDSAVDENLHKWFKEKWVRFGPDGKIRGDCARGDDSEGKPKCLPQAKAHSLGKKGRASAAARKRREDPNPERSGKAINVNTKKKTDEEQLDELKCWPGHHRVPGTRAGAPGSCTKNESVTEEQQQCPECGGPMFSELLINEKKDACYYKVKSRYKVWPSAYASGALVKCRKKGAANWGNGGKSNESVVEYGTHPSQRVDPRTGKKYVPPKSPLGQGVDEAIKLGAPHKQWDKKDLQAYLTRIKTGTTTKQDKFRPIIHASNIKAITKDEENTEWDLEDLASQVTTRPNTLLGTNAKMAKSKKEGAITYDLTLPALNGIVVDEEASAGGEPVFVEVTTCPGAGECKTYCYARKGGYRMFPGSSMSAARALNFLLNHPEDYMKLFDSEVKLAKNKTDKAGIDLLVRVHDAGDFFSKEYYDLSMNVARNNPDTRFYFYSKMGDIVSDPDAPPNVVNSFSPGAQSREIKKVQAARAKGQFVKDAVTLQKEFFKGLFKTDPKGKYVKDGEGRTVIASSEAWDKFKDKLASTYNIDKDSIITYDQMVKIKEPGPIGYKNKLQKDGKIVKIPVYAPPNWNVVVFPSGHGDLGAPRKDVRNQFLMFH